MKQKDWLIMAIFTFLVVTIWIVFDVYHAYTSKIKSPVEEKLMGEIVPKFDHDTIIKIVEEH